MFIIEIGPDEYNRLPGDWANRLTLEAAGGKEIAMNVSCPYTKRLGRIPPGRCGCAVPVSRAADTPVGSLAGIRRKERRSRTMGLLAVLTDGRAEYTGVVEDLSGSGMQIGQVPVAFEPDPEHCPALVLAPYADLRFSLVPRWTRETRPGMYKTLGFEITEPSDEWHQFVEQLDKRNKRLAYLLAENQTGGMH